MKTALGLNFKRIVTAMLIRDLALKLKFVKGRVYETYNTKKVRKENKEEGIADEETVQRWKNRTFKFRSLLV